MSIVSNVKSSVFVGDLHLRPQTWTNRPEIKQDSYDSLTQIIEFCVANQSSLVLMGDIFNASRPDSLSIDFFRLALKIMKSKGLPVYAIQGQHDRSIPPWPTAVCGDDITYVHMQTFEPLAGKVFYGIDQQPVAEDLKKILSEVPKNVTGLVMHQLAREVFPLDGAWDFDTTWVGDGIEHLYIGDYHVAADFPFKGGTAYYSGSTYLCSISENPNKSFLHLTVGGDSKLSTNRVPLQTRRYHKHVVNSTEQLDALVELFSHDFPVDPLDSKQTPVVVLEYLVSVPDVMKRIAPLLKDRAYLWPVPASNRVEWRRSGAASDEVVQHASMEACATVFHASDTPAYAFLIELLNTPDTESVLTKWRAQMGVA